MVVDEHLLVLSLRLLASEHLQELLGVGELLLGVLLEGGGHLLVVEADVPLADAVEEAGEGAGEMVVLGPDFLEVALEGPELLGLELVEDFLLLLLLVLVEADLLFEGVLGVLDEDGLWVGAVLQ